MKFIKNFFELFRYPQTCQECGVERKKYEKLFKEWDAMYMIFGPYCPKCNDLIIKGKQPFDENLNIENGKYYGSKHYR